MGLGHPYVPLAPSLSNETPKLQVRDRTAAAAVDCQKIGGSTGHFPAKDGRVSGRSGNRRPTLKFESELNGFVFGLKI